MGNKIRHKNSVAIEAGFKCGTCEHETITFDGSTPETCGNCGAPGPTLVWKDKITNKTTVETLPLK